MRTRSDVHPWETRWWLVEALSRGLETVWRKATPTPEALSLTPWKWENPCKESKGNGQKAGNCLLLGGKAGWEVGGDAEGKRKNRYSLPQQRADGGEHTGAPSADLATPLGGKSRASKERVVYISAVQENFLQWWECSLSALSNTGATGHMWLPSTWRWQLQNWSFKLGAKPLKFHDSSLPKRLALRYNFC